MDEPRAEPRAGESVPVTVAFAATGVVAGLVSPVVFAALHALFISDIWFSLAPMLLAGALCGLCVAWTFALLVPEPTAGGWIRYNLVYLGLFVLVGAASVVVFEPIATIAELSAMGGSPGDLILASTPLNLAAVAVGTVLVTRRYRGGTRHVGAVLLTVALLVLFLGHNVSIIGLVEFGSGELPLLAGFSALVVAINAVYVAAFLVLARGRLLVARRRPAASGDPLPSGGTPW